jgi:hypothetical protein
MIREHRLAREFSRSKKTVLEREQPVSDPARQVHVQDQDRCCLVSKNGVAVQGAINCAPTRASFCRGVIHHALVPDNANAHHTSNHHLERHA